MICVAIFGKYLAPYGLNEMTTHVMSPPRSIFGWEPITSARYLERVITGPSFGSCWPGGRHDKCSHIYGHRVVSGYIGGVLDLIVQRFVDALVACPV